MGWVLNRYSKEDNDKKESKTTPDTEVPAVYRKYYYRYHGSDGVRNDNDN